MIGSYIDQIHVILDEQRQKGDMPTGFGSIALLLAFSLATGCACGNSDRGAGDGGSLSPFSFVGQSFKFCEAHLAWEKKCAAVEPTPREEPFWGETDCLNEPWHYVQQRFIDAAAACFASLPCESSDDPCTNAGYRAIGIETAADMENDALASRCGKIAEQCPDLNGDSCFRFVIFTQAGRSAVAACLDLECSQIDPCLHDLGTQP
jgi:hypothetical protein